MHRLMLLRRAGIGFNKYSEIKMKQYRDKNFKLKAAFCDV